jgi:hypothetical protein
MPTLLPLYTKHKKLHHLIHQLITNLAQHILHDRIIQRGFCPADSHLDATNISAPLSGTRPRRKIMNVQVQEAHNGPSSPVKVVHCKGRSTRPRNYQLITVMYEPDQKPLIRPAMIPICLAPSDRRKVHVPRAKWNCLATSDQINHSWRASSRAIWPSILVQNKWPLALLLTMREEYRPTTTKEADIIQKWEHVIKSRRNQDNIKQFEIPRSILRRPMPLPSS